MISHLVNVQSRGELWLTGNTSCPPHDPLYRYLIMCAFAIVEQIYLWIRTFQPLPRSFQEKLSIIARKVPHNTFQSMDNLIQVIWVLDHQGAQSVPMALHAEASQYSALLSCPSLSPSAQYLPVFQGLRQYWPGAGGLRRTLSQQS